MGKCLRKGATTAWSPEATEEARRAVMTTLVGDVASEVHIQQRSDHEREYQRIDNPRPGEEMWDVGNNK